MSAKTLFVNLYFMIKKSMIRGRVKIISIVDGVVEFESVLGGHVHTHIFGGAGNYDVPILSEPVKFSVKFDTNEYILSELEVGREYHVDLLKVPK